MKNTFHPCKVTLDVVSVDRLLDLGDPLFSDPRLNPEAVARILEGAECYPRHAGFRIEITVPPKDLGRDEEVREAVSRHFEREQKDAGQKLREIFHNGRVATVVGLIFVAVLLGIGQAIARISEGYLAMVLSESMTVFAWVAMWRPAELLLYEHWPVRRRRNLALRLAGADVALCVRP